MGKDKDDKQETKPEKFPNRVSQTASGMRRDDRVGSSEDPPPS